jgi:hypothetical protein
MNDGAFWKWLAWKYFQSQGLSLEGRKFVVIPPQDLQKNLEAGRVQAIVNIGYITAGEVAITSKDHPEAFTVLTGVKRDVLQAMSRDELKAYWRAIVRGNAWVNTPDNRQELHEILMKEALEPGLMGITDDAGYAYQLQINKFLTPEEMLRVNADLKTSIRSLVEFRENVMQQDVSVINLDERIETGALLEVLEEMGLADKTAAAE